MQKTTAQLADDAISKVAKITTELMPHQQRVIERIQEQPGLLVAHGLGTGKTLTSIGAADLFKGQTRALVPASLVANYKKEIEEHTRGPSRLDVVSAQGAALRNELTPVELLILDEAHRAREVNTKLNKLLRNYPAEKRLFLTATPVYNRPSDIAPLINLVAQEEVLPLGREFNKRYVQSPSRSLLKVLFGGSRKAKLKNTEELSKVLGKWTDYQTLEGGDFPARVDESISVPMSPEQTALHDYAWGKLPFISRLRLKAGLPPSKQDLPQLNKAFQSQARQIGGSTKQFTQDNVLTLSPKLQRALKDLQSSEGNTVVYSNYLDTLKDYSQALGEADISHGLFTGKQSQKDRKQIVQDYNEGKLRALLLSSAGGEGLDLKKTRQVQVLEPHWNEEKLEQVIGRAIRHGSHTDLLPEDRNVMVKRYTTYPRPGMFSKLFKRKPRGVEQVLEDMAVEKRELNEQLLALLSSK